MTISLWMCVGDKRNGPVVFKRDGAMGFSSPLMNKEHYDIAN